MGGCRCSYKNCTNTTKTRDNLHFFHYPVKQKERCKVWIENANKPQFYDLDEDQLRNKVICETHFQDCYFPNSQKKRLLQGAVPTLDGDCVKETPINRRVMKIQDVQVLPANDDGTIFVLETNNMQSNFQSEKIESYIYTNNGLVLPINKCNEISDDSIQVYSGSEVEEIYEAPTNKIKRENLQVAANLNNDNVIDDKEFDPIPFPTAVNIIEDVQMNVVDNSKKTQEISCKPVKSPIKISDDLFTKTLGSKYVNKIKQHSKDIAILKRLIKSQTAPHRKISNTLILNNLKRQIPLSLFNLVSFNLNSNNCEFSADDLELYTTIYSASPELYQTLSEKFKWNLPNIEALLTNKNNGHVHRDEK